MHEVRKTVTVLFADVVASTELGERLDPEAVRQVVSRYFAEMAQVIERHGGTVEKFIGDEVMAVFGVPAIHEDDALRAVRAAAAMRNRLEGLNDELEERSGARLEIRIGVNTGEVVAGDPSTGHAFVTGSMVNLAKRIEQAAKPGEILLGDETSRLVRHAVVTTLVGPVTVKGKHDAIVVWRLDEVDASSEAFPRRLDAPLVGRAVELDALRAAYARAIETRRPQLATVLGPAGIGKSRLVWELLEEVAGEAEVRVGRCLPYGEGITFWPVREVLPEELFEDTTEEIFRRVRKQLQEIADARPLVVCFEDVQWGEPTFLDLIQYLAGWMREAPVLFVCLARPDLLERRPDWPTTGADTLALRLGRLSDDEAATMLDHLSARGEIRTRITEAAEGNPLFVEQMAAMAAEEGSDVTVPPSIWALLTARLAHLDASETAVIERAAVIGREFPLQAVIDLSPSELRQHVSGHLLGLVRKELVRPYAVGEDDRFRFRHGLIRDAAYDAMPKGLRAELHERHAAWLEEAGNREVIIGYHLEQAVHLRRELALYDDSTERLALRAGGLVGGAGQRAFRRGDLPASRNLLGRARALLVTKTRRTSTTTAIWQTRCGSSERSTGRMHPAGVVRGRRG
jgi:class 3 adenylate cyclase